MNIYIFKLTYNNKIKNVIVRREKEVARFSRKYIVVNFQLTKKKLVIDQFYFFNRTISDNYKQAYSARFENFKGNFYNMSQNDELVCEYISFYSKIINISYS